MRDLLLATTNPAKIAQLRGLVEGLPLRVITPADLPDIAPGINEDGPDFAANAAQKACGWSVAAGGMLAMASDGGMEIPALGERWTALRTRRNAGPGADDTERIRHLLDLMRDLRGDNRRTFWHEAVALALDGTVLRSWTADSDGGLIVDKYRPTSGGLTNGLQFIGVEVTIELADGGVIPEVLGPIDGVWPRLRAEIQPYLRAWNS